MSKIASVKRLLICFAFLALLITACAPVSQPAPAPTALPQATMPESDTRPTPAAQDVNVPTAVPGTAPAATANCASAEAAQLGAAISIDYAFTSPEQVMAWFCAGAEFEDILVALETADQTGASPEEMLTMLAAGLTWEEIWQVVGLTN